MVAPCAARCTDRTRLTGQLARLARATARTLLDMKSRRRWIWPAVVWTVCASLGIGYSAATYQVFFGCNAALIWLVFGPPTLMAAGAFGASIWGRRRAVTTAGRLGWVVAAVASAIYCAFLAVGLLLSLSVSCEFYDGKALSGGREVRGSLLMLESP